MKCIAFHCHFDEAKAESLSRASRLEPALTLSAAKGNGATREEIPLETGIGCGFPNPIAKGFLLALVACGNTAHSQ